MALLRGSIDVDVPLEFADLEWSEFVFESLFSTYSRGFADVAPLIDAQDESAGKVSFETEGERLVKVTVEMDYTPQAATNADEEIAHAQATLERDLAKYKVFVLDRCERAGCRTA